MPTTVITTPSYQTPERKSQRAALLDEFLALLPREAVLHTEEELRPYECDGLTAYRRLPMLAVLPSTVSVCPELAS